MGRLLYGEELAELVNRRVYGDPYIVGCDADRVQRVTQGQIASLEAVGCHPLLVHCRYDPEIVRDLTPES